MRKFAAVVLLVTPLLSTPFPGTALADMQDDAEVAWLRCDYETAHRLYSKLAAEGCTFAASRLGDLYYFGRGVPRDYERAMEWYLKAAGQGDASAQFAVGRMYSMGQGAPQDYPEAASWYRKAADQGDPEAQSTLGLLYVTGEGVPYDFVLAYMWYDLAASGYAEERKRELAAMNRDQVARSLTKEQLAEARRLANERQAGRAK